MKATWNNKKDTVEDSLNLTKGILIGSPIPGFLVQQSVEPDQVLEAATALQGYGEQVVLGSQAGLIVKAQQLKLAFGEYGKFSLG